jgi:hypothetical protein
MQTGLALIGWLYIMFKTGEWLTKSILKQWDKRRKFSARQRAVNDLYAAYELDKIKNGHDMKITTKGNLVILMYRTEDK